MQNWDNFLISGLLKVVYLPYNLKKSFFYFLISWKKNVSKSDVKMKIGIDQEMPQLVLIYLFCDLKRLCFGIMCMEFSLKTFDYI